jgi:phosphohistidine phosphatase
MLRLILLRHAKSAWPDGVSDHERPLADRGQEAAPLIGAHMAARGLVPNKLIVSTAKRTRETQALVATKLAMPKPVFDKRIYEASWSQLLDVVREQPPKASPLMLIGHNPGIATLASMLSDAMKSNGAALLKLTSKVPTAALIVIDFDLQSFAEIDREDGGLVEFTTPRMLGGVDED